MRKLPALSTFTGDMLASFFEFVRSKFHTLNHHHQLVPLHVQRGGILIKSREPKAARLQLFVVDHHTGIFHVKDLHDVLTAVNENEYPATTNILVHRVIYNTTQGIKTLAHIYRQRIKIVLKGSVEMEHTINQ
jgi:hypothetical protein